MLQVFLSKNVAVDYKLANGTRANLHSLVLSDDDADLQTRLAALQPGQEIILNSAPRYVNVCVDLSLPMEMRSVRPPEDAMDVDQLSSIIAVPPSAEPIVCALNGHNFNVNLSTPDLSSCFP